MGFEIGLVKVLNYKKYESIPLDLREKIYLDVIKLYDLATKEKEVKINEDYDLSKFLVMSVAEQGEYKEEIITKFKKFWDTNPTEEEFHKNINGLVLFPKMLYYMIKKRV